MDYEGASFIAQLVKYLPAVKETQLQFLDWEDTLEKEMQPIPVLLPGESHGQKSLVTVHGDTRVRHDLVTKPPPRPCITKTPEYPGHLSITYLS